MPQPAEADGRATLSLGEVAELLGVSYGVVYESCRRGEIPAIRIGRRLHVPASWARDLAGDAAAPATASAPAAVKEALTAALDALGQATRACAGALAALDGAPASLQADAGQTAAPTSRRTGPLTRANSGRSA